MEWWSPHGTRKWSTPKPPWVTDRTPLEGLSSQCIQSRNRLLMSQLNEGMNKCSCTLARPMFRTWGITVRTCQDFTGIIPNLFTACHHLVLSYHVHLYTYHLSRNIYPHISRNIYSITDLYSVWFTYLPYLSELHPTPGWIEEKERSLGTHHGTGPRLLDGTFFFCGKERCSRSTSIKQDTMIMIIIYIYIYICNRCKLYITVYLKSIWVCLPLSLTLYVWYL